MPLPNDPAAAPVTVERFVKQLVITYKAVTLYPAASSIPRENAEAAILLLDTVLAENPEMKLTITKSALHFEEATLFLEQAAFVNFAQELYNRTISEIRFHAGVNPESLVSLLGILQVPADELRQTGGVSARLWESGVDAITVVETSTTVIDAEESASVTEDEEGWPPDDALIDELLAAKQAGKPYDRRVLVRFVLDSPPVREYLSGAFDRHGGDPAEAARKIDIAGLAQVADTETGERRAEALQSLAEAVSRLDPRKRRAIVAENLLSGSRSDDSVSNLVRQLGVDTVCRALVGDLADGEVSTDALARALRNLTLISMAGRDEVLDSAGAAMRAVGFEEGRVDEVIEAIAPRRLVERPGAEPALTSHSPESILRLIETAPSVSESAEEDPAVAKLRDEARTGLTDGDVMGALVTLAIVDTGARGFARAMEDLEEGLELLIGRGEFGVAADAAESLIRAAEAAPPERWESFTQAVARLASAGQLRSVHKALRLYRKGSPEYTDCMRLLRTLGTLAIDPLLEVLSDEPDMLVRKSLVDLISTIADSHIDEVGERVADRRWYVVRNVVSILGATRKVEALPFLARTVRHADARVRRESIRAIAGIHDPMVPPMLISALDDADGPNVQLAARYLGSLKVAAAVGALERVALGEGKGNRDQGPRIEAVEALGSIGSKEALPALKVLAGRKGRLRSGLQRNVAAAAQSAAATIATGDGGEGR